MPSSSLLIQQKNPGTIYKTNIRRHIRRWKKDNRPLENIGPKENMVMSCLGFLFASNIPDVELKKPIGTDQKAPVKVCSL